MACYRPAVAGESPMTILLCCIALLAGGALGAAWRGAAKNVEIEYWRTLAEEWKAVANEYIRMSHGLPAHELPMSCVLGSRPALSERLEGPVAASSLDQLIKGEEP